MLHGLLRPFWEHGNTQPMRIIARRTLKAYLDRHSGARDHVALTNAVNAWFDEARKAAWTSTADVKRRYVTASIVTAERIVFNIKGNDHRLIVSVDFEKSIVWIKWIGTHAEYDRIDAKEIEHGR